MNAVKNLQNNFWEKNSNIKLQEKHIFCIINTSGKKILDLGCGNGNIALELKKKGFEVQGIDISEKSKEICEKKGIDVKILDMATQKLPFKDNFFDTVIISDVLEHIFDPEFILKEARRVSKHKIIITTPNFSSLSQRLSVLFGKVPFQNKPQRGGHCYWFNRLVIKNMTKRNNLKIVLWGNASYMSKSLLGLPFKFLEKLFPNLFSLSLNVVLLKSKR